MHAADGQRLTGARIAAPVRCAPPANKPTPDERDTCAPWFDRELDAARADAAGRAGARRVRVGRVPGGRRAARLDRAGARARFAHGATAELLPDGAPVTLLATYHVSQQNTFTGRLTEGMLDSVLKAARAFAP